MPGLIAQRLREKGLTTLDGLEGRLISADDWLRSFPDGRVAFYRFGNLFDTTSFMKCRLVAHHLGNEVIGEGTASTSGEAFYLAILQVEKTIGTAWRGELTGGRDETTERTE